MTCLALGANGSRPARPVSAPLANRLLLSPARAAGARPSRPKQGSQGSPAHGIGAAAQELASGFVADIVFEVVALSRASLVHPADRILGRFGAGSQCHTPGLAMLIYSRTHRDSSVRWRAWSRLRGWWARDLRRPWTHLPRAAGRLHRGLTGSKRSAWRATLERLRALRGGTGVRATAGRCSRSGTQGYLPACSSADCARARAASTNWGSLSVTKAWRGVLVRSLRTVQTSRDGALKMSSEAGGALRFQSV